MGTVAEVPKVTFIWDIRMSDFNDQSKSTSWCTTKISLQRAAMKRQTEQWQLQRLSIDWNFLLCFKVHFCSLKHIPVNWLHQHKNALCNKWQFKNLCCSFECSSFFNTFRHLLCLICSVQGPMFLTLIGMFHQVLVHIFAYARYLLT